MRRIAHLFAVAACLGAGLAADAAADDGARPVVLAPVVEREIKQGRAFVGTVEPVHAGEVDVQTSGFVEALLVEEGDPVDLHTPLAKLRTKTLDIRLRAARAELLVRQQALLELNNGSREEDKQEARARLAEARTAESTAEWKLGALRSLREKKQVSEEELLDARHALAIAKARREGLEAALARVEAGPRAERIAQAAASVAVQDAEIARLEDEKERHTVLAPFKGYVVKKHTEVGAWLETGGAVFDLVGVDEVDVVIPVLEDAVAHLVRGMVVNVTIDALPEPHVQGEIHRIVPVADRRARTIPVKVRIKNVMQGKTPLIKAGMFARVTLAVGEERKAVLVPKDAVVLGGRTPVVYVYDAKAEMAAQVPVTLGVAIDDLIEVEGAVEKGQQVVIRGNERIFPGTKVRPVEGR